MEEKVQVAMRIPSKIHDKILKVSQNEIYHKTKTDVIVAILKKFFQDRENEKKDFAKELEGYGSSSKEKENDLVDDLENMFSLGEKIFMSRKVYKQILQKSESKIEYEIKTGMIDSITVAGIDFVVLESNLDTNSIVIEQILQKKEIAALKRRIDILESKEGKPSSQE